MVLPRVTTIESAAQYMRGKGGVVVVSAGNNGIDEGIAPSDAMIVVSATDSNDAKTSWSSYGSFVDLAAPGLNILTTKRGGGYWYCWGTSFASPIVAGVAAQLKSMRPNFTASQIESALLSSADDLGTTAKDSLYGYGRVNAARAVAAIGTTPVDATAPAVTIAAPTAGTVSGTVTVSVSASDNVGVARVDLMVNGKLFGSTASAPFDFVWNTANMPNGSATLSAVAYDAAGNNAVSAPGRVTVSNYVTDTTAPTVAITSPSDGSSLGRMTNVTATASDDNGLAWAQLTIDGEVVASSTSGDLRYKWNTRKVKSGSHTISVSAADTAGNTASTSIVVRQ